MLFSLYHSPFSSFHTQYECRMHTTPNKCKIIFVIAIYGVMSMLIGVLDRETHKAISYYKTKQIFFAPLCECAQTLTSAFV